MLSLPTTGPAHADDATPLAPLRFTSLAPDGARSEVNGEFVTGSVEPDNSPFDVTTVHVDAQYIVARGAGAYARLGVVHTSSRSFDDDTGLVGTELGGFQRLRIAREVAVTGRIGVVLPTTSDTSAGLVAGRYALEARRPSDLAMLSLDDAVLRLAATPTYTRGPVTARLDVGVDALLRSSADLEDSPYHVDLAVGLQHRAASATLEFSTFGAFSHSFRRYAATIGAHYQLRRVVVSASLGTPFTTGEFPYPPPSPDFDPSVGLGERLAFTLGVSVGI